MHKFYWNLATNKISLKSSSENCSHILNTNVSSPGRNMHRDKCRPQTAYSNFKWFHESLIYSHNELDKLSNKRSINFRLLIVREWYAHASCDLMPDYIWFRICQREFKFTRVGFQILANHPTHLEQFDRAIATALKSLLASGASRTTPLALCGAITWKIMLIKFYTQNYH